MTLTKTQICNMALAHLAISKELSNVDTTDATTPIGKACNLFYETARDKVFRDFLWPFATRVDALSLVQEEPSTEWRYAYRYPSDCKRIVRIVSGVRPETRSTRANYRVLADGTGRLIYTDKEEAELEYVMQLTDVTKWPEDFVMMVSLLLAFLIAPRVTGGDQFKLGARAYQAYAMAKAETTENAANEEQPDEPGSDLLAARN
jgi:hypothetical protein